MTLSSSIAFPVKGKKGRFPIMWIDMGPVEKWEGSDKNLRNWPRITWPIYIINH